MSSSAANIQSAERSLAVLEYVAGVRRPVSNKELAAEFRLPKSTMHHIVNTLVNLGYLQKVPGRQYALGPRFLALGRAADFTRQRFAPARSILISLWERFDETFYLNAYEYGTIHVLMVFESRKPVRVGGDATEREPALHCTATGKLMLAYSSRSERNFYLQPPLKQWTPNSLVDPDDIHRELDRIVEQGFAEDREEHYEGIECLAVPIFDVDDRLVASVSVRVPKFRMAVETRSQLLAAMNDATASIRARCLGIPS